jgi:hypothetical protein
VVAKAWVPFRRSGPLWRASFGTGPELLQLDCPYEAADQLAEAVATAFRQHPDAAINQRLAAAGHVCAFASPLDACLRTP